MNVNNIDLLNFLKQTATDAVIIFNSKGEYIKSENIKSGKNFSAMNAVLITMANELAEEEISLGGLKQLVYKGEKGLFILDQLNKDLILGVYCKDLTKSGLIMLSIEKLKETK